MAAKRRTGLDKQSSALPIILGALAVAAVLGLIGGVVWGMSSSGSGGGAGAPTPLPSQSSPTASPTTASPTPTPTLSTTTPAPTLTTATPTLTPTPTTTSPSPTPTTPSGIPPAPASSVLSSNGWDLNNYTFKQVNGKFGMTAYVANRSATPRSATFVIYIYISGKYVGNLTGSIGLTPTTTSGPGTPITFTSVYPYQTGTKVLLFTAK